MAFLDKAVNFVDRVTKLPGEVSREADAVNDWFIDMAGNLQGAADRMANKTKKNLTENKVNSLGRGAAQWIQSGNNLWIALGALVGIIFVIRKI